MLMMPVPRLVAWELTRRCNLRCAHCRASAGPDGANGQDARSTSGDGGGGANGQDARSTRGGAVCGTGILPVRADEMFARWYSHLLDRGIYVAPSRFEAMFVSDAHTDADIDRTIEVIEEFL